MHRNHYLRLFGMTVLSFISMYILMYAMVDVFANVYPNYNQFYMAGLMTVPMVLIELALMGSMYPKKQLNVLIGVASAIALIAFWFAVREQVAISDKQFLKSMIPHHANAILMCKEAAIRDPEIQRLCQMILTGQQAEIDQTKSMLNRLSR